MTSKEFQEGMTQFRIDQIMETLQESEALLADGFESALIGHTQGPYVVAVYDYDMCVHILMERDGMSCLDAIEFMEYNVVGSLGKGCQSLYPWPEYQPPNLKK